MIGGGHGNKNPLTFPRAFLDPSLIPEGDGLAEPSYYRKNHSGCLKLCIVLGLVYTILDYLLCRFAFLNPLQKMHWNLSVYTQPGKQPSDTISCQNNFITSVIFVVFFAYLPSNRPTSFALKPSYYQSESWERFVLYYDVYTRNKTVQIVLNPFSYHLLIRRELYRIVGAERIGFMQSRVNTTPIRYEKGSDK